MDFAQKFETRRHMEKQDQYFGKKGLSWHITVIAFKQNRKLKQFTLIHLLEDAAQDSNCVMGVVDSVLSFINVNFEQPQVSFRSDNAGCYHSQELICLLSLFASNHKVRVLSYHFSEPQIGKDACDRKISIFKMDLIQYVNDRNDVTNIEQMKLGLLDNKHSEDVRIYTCRVSENLNLKKWSRYQVFLNITRFCMKTKR